MKLIPRITLIISALAIGLAFSSCTTGERGATTGAVAGGALGAAVAGSGNRATGALIGGAVGAVAGSEMAKNREHRRRSGWYY